ncbi:MAG: arylamine N-acetyltransferase family protein [Polyangiales bacterium]
MLDLEAYFARIGLSGTPRPRTLDSLHRAHVSSIPFENLDVLAGRGIDLSLDAVVDKLVHRRRGGYCFEHVTLFSAVLAELGFRFRVTGGRVHVGSALAIPPRTHASLIVELPEGRFFADPGFGGVGPYAPMPLVEDRVQGSHRLVRRDDAWVLQNEHEGRFVDLHAFTLDPFHPIDLEVANHYTSTHPRSRFKSTLMVQRHLPNGRVALRDRELVMREADEVRRTQLADDAAIHAALREHFGLEIPREDLHVP